MSNFHAGTPASVDQALAHFRKATALDAEYASAYGMAAWRLFWRRLNGWSTDLEQDTAEGARLSRSAVDLARTTLWR